MAAINQQRIAVEKIVSERMEENAEKMKQRIESTNNKVLQTFKVGDVVQVLKESAGVRSRVSKRRKLESPYHKDPKEILEIKDGRFYLLKDRKSGEIILKSNKKPRYFTSVWLAPFVGSLSLNEETSENEEIEEQEEEDKEQEGEQEEEQAVFEPNPQKEEQEEEEEQEANEYLEDVPKKKKSAFRQFQDITDGVDLGKRKRSAPKRRSW